MFYIVKQSDIHSFPTTVSDTLATATTCIERTEALTATSLDKTNKHIKDSTVTVLQALQRSVDLNKMVSGV
jgi:hypothetical protein